MQFLYLIVTALQNNNCLRSSLHILFSCRSQFDLRVNCLCNSIKNSIKTLKLWLNRKLKREQYVVQSWQHCRFLWNNFFILKVQQRLSTLSRQIEGTIYLSKAKVSLNFAHAEKGKMARNYLTVSSNSFKVKFLLTTMTQYVIEKMNITRWRNFKMSKNSFTLNLCQPKVNIQSKNWT